MANRHRGEIEAEIGGVRRRLVLTLGALAELEDAFGADDLVALTERFGAGRMKARDLTRIIGAGLRGAGESVSDDEVAAMAIDGGAQVWRELRHRAERQGVAADARVARRLEHRYRRGYCSRACCRSENPDCRHL